MNELACFVAVEFVDDPNVRGLTYWYLCDFNGAAENDFAVAPLGKHNNLQRGVIRRVLYAKAEDAPYPLNYIKSIRKLIKPKEDNNV